MRAAFCGWHAISLEMGHPILALSNCAPHRDSADYLLAHSLVTLGRTPATQYYLHVQSDRYVGKGKWRRLVLKRRVMRQTQIAAIEAVSTPF